MAGEAQKELDAEPEAPAAPQQPPAKQEGGGGAKQKMVTKEAEEEEAGPETGDEGKQEFERQQMGELAVYSAKCLWMVNRSIIENEEVHMQLHAVKEWQKQLSGDGGSSGHVMISYSWSCKKDFVVRLAEKLKTKQVPVWRDEDQLRFGCNLQNSMFNAVEGAALVVVFYSSFYFRSANCQFEYKNILGLKRPIFPIIFQQPAAQAEKAALTAADQQTQSEYQDWLAGQLHSHSPDEKLYFDASRADPDEKTFDTLVEDIRQQFHEQLKHFKPNASSVPVAQWTAEQVTAWLEKQNLKELYAPRPYLSPLLNVLYCTVLYSSEALHSRVSCRTASRSIWTARRWRRSRATRRAAIRRTCSRSSRQSTTSTAASPFASCPLCGTSSRRSCSFPLAAATRPTAVSLPDDNSMFATSILCAQYTSICKIQIQKFYAQLHSTVFVFHCYGTNTHILYRYSNRICTRTLHHETYFVQYMQHVLFLELLFCFLAFQTLFLRPKVL